MPLTVAVTGPTGEIGLPLMEELERDRRGRVGAGDGAAARSTRLARLGEGRLPPRRHPRPRRAWRRSSTAPTSPSTSPSRSSAAARRRGGSTSRAAATSSRSAVAAGVKRLVYASSVAAYGFHPANPQPLTEEVPARGSESFYYSAQKAELEATLSEIAAGDRRRRLRLPALHRRRAAGDDADRAGRQRRPPRRPAAGLRRGLGRLPLPAPLLPDSGLPIQLVHHDDVATALAAAIAGTGRPAPTTSPATGEIGVADIARALGWRSVRVPGTAVGVGTAVAQRLRFLSPQLEWATAFATPVLMDAGKARRELGWEPRFDAAETLLSDRRLGAAEERLCVELGDDREGAGCRRRARSGCGRRCSRRRPGAGRGGGAVLVLGRRADRGAGDVVEVGDLAVAGGRLAC